METLNRIMYQVRALNNSIYYTNYKKALARVQRLRSLNIDSEIINIELPIKKCYN